MKRWMKFLFLGVLVAACAATTAYTRKRPQECVKPPESYGPLHLKTCQMAKGGDLVCAYSICMNDPLKTLWCGILTLKQEICKGEFKPFGMYLEPVDEQTDEEKKAQKDREEQL